MAIASTGKTGPVGVGFIGAGNISDAYLTNLTTFPDVKVLFISDIDQDRAKSQAEKWGVPAYGTVDELLANPDIEIVVNLTIPAAHVPVALQCVAAGKHVWTEKPYGLDRESAQELYDAAKAAGVLVCVAPDTILGGGIQSGIRAIREGKIGKPTYASTTFQYVGPDVWHPGPEFLYAKGGGPLMDMGPYYLSTLVYIFGAVKRVTAIGSKARQTRVIKEGPRAGTEFPVEVPTHISAMLEFANGGSAHCTLSFETSKKIAGVVEVNGTDGTIDLPDPNMFDGNSKLYTGMDGEEELQLSGTTYGRGTGVLEMAQSIREGRPVRLPGDIAFHVLDVMLALGEAADSHEWVEVKSTLPPIDLLPQGWDPAVATLS